MACIGCTEFLTQGSGTVGSGLNFSFEKVVIAEDPDNIPLVLLSVRALDKDDVLLVDQTPAWLEATTSGQSVLVGARLIYRLTVTVEIDAFRILDPGSGDPAEWGEGTYTIELRAQVEDGSKPVIVCLFDVCISGSVSFGNLYAAMFNVAVDARVICVLDVNDPLAGWQEYARTDFPAVTSFGIDETRGRAYAIPTGVSDEILEMLQGTTAANVLTMDAAVGQTIVECSDNAEFILVGSFAGSADTINVQTLDGSDVCDDTFTLLGVIGRLMHDKVREIFAIIIADGSDRGMYFVNEACGGFTTVFDLGSATENLFEVGWYPQRQFIFNIGESATTIRARSYFDNTDLPIDSIFADLVADGRAALGLTVVSLAFHPESEILWYTTDNGDATFSLWKKSFNEWNADADRSDYSGGVKSYEVEVLVDCYRADLMPADVAANSGSKLRFPIDTTLTL